MRLVVLLDHGTYLFSLAIAILTVNSWTLSCITDPLQDGRLSRICSSYNEDSELDIWNRAGLIGTHWIGIRRRDGARAREGLVGTHWIGIHWSDRARARDGLIETHWIGIRWSEVATAGQIGTHWFDMRWTGSWKRSSHAAIPSRHRTNPHRPYIS